jgi:hypothetical protein
MKEEEAVFGPLLKENFERKELEDMNETVLKQHTLFREKVRSEKSLVKAVKRKRSGDVFDELDFTLDDLRFRKSYCQEVNDHLVIINIYTWFPPKGMFCSIIDSIIPVMCSTSWTSPWTTSGSGSPIVRRSTITW